jgi:uncharacterized protein YuzE
MKIRYYRETGHPVHRIQGRAGAETRDLDENTVLDFDPDGRITAITVEHASERTGIPQFSYEQIAV